MSTNLQAVNEPVRSYESGSDDRKNLQIKYDQMASEVVEIPLIIGGKSNNKTTRSMRHAS